MAFARSRCCGIVGDRCEAKLVSGRFFEIVGAAIHSNQLPPL
jgi:hypothetical protein